jgi:hypothetical protein
MEANIGAQSNAGPQASFTMAITMPARTKTQISACVQIQKGDMWPS